MIQSRRSIRDFRLRVLIASLLLFSCWLPCRAESQQKFETAEFTILLPQPWVEIPKSALAQAAQSMAKKATGEPREFAYGYQSKRSTQWLEIPYILVEIVNSGRLSEAQLEKYSVLTAKEKMQAAVAQVTSGETWYDPQSRSVITVKKVSNGSLFAISALRLTQNGGIQFSAYCTASTSESFVPLFLAAMQSVAVVPALEYRTEATAAPGKPKLSSADALEQSLTKVAVYVILGAIVAVPLFFVLSRRGGAKRSMVTPTSRSGWAIAAGYLALFTLIILPAPLTLLVSIIAIWDIRRSRHTSSPKMGMGRAIFGLIAGLAGTILLGFALVDMLAKMP